MPGAQEDEMSKKTAKVVAILICIAMVATAVAGAIAFL